MPTVSRLHGSLAITAILAATSRSWKHPAAPSFPASRSRSRRSAGGSTSTAPSRAVLESISIPPMQTKQSPPDSRSRRWTTTGQDHGDVWCSAVLSLLLADHRRALLHGPGQLRDSPGAQRRPTRLHCGGSGRGYRAAVSIAPAERLGDERKQIGRAHV